MEKNKIFRNLALIFIVLFILTRMESIMNSLKISAILASRLGSLFTVLYLLFAFIYLYEGYYANYELDKTNLKITKILISMFYVIFIIGGLLFVYGSFMNNANAYFIGMILAIVGVILYGSALIIIAKKGKKNLN